MKNKNSQYNQLIGENSYFLSMLDICWLSSTFASQNTDRLQQVEDYVRGCTTSTKY